MDMNTKIKTKQKTKQKISLLMAVVMLMTMIPMGSFALNSLPLKEVRREYKVQGEEHKQALEIKVPLTEFNVPTDIDPAKLYVTPAYSVGTREIVKEFKYEKYAEAVSPNEDPNREVNKFGYITFKLNKDLGGVGNWTSLRIAVDAEGYNSAVTYLTISLIENPDLTPSDGKLPAPKNLKWIGNTGKVQWDHVKEAVFDDAGITKYVVQLVRTKGDNVDILDTQVVSLNKGTTVAETDFSDPIYAYGPGSYKFQVAALGKSTNKDDPQGYFALSSTPLNYSPATTKLGMATKLEWKKRLELGEDNFIATWTAPSNIKAPDYYIINLYREGDTGPIKRFEKRDLAIREDDRLFSIIKASGDGLYTFKIQAKTGRKLEFLDGDESLPSNIIEKKGNQIYIDGKSQSGKINQAPLKLTATPLKVGVRKPVKLAVSGGSSKGEVSYNIVGGNGSGIIDRATSTLTTTRPGTIKVQATMKGLKVGDKDYNDVDSNIVDITVEVASVDLEVKTDGNNGVVTIPDEKVNELIALAPYQPHGAAVIDGSKKGSITSLAVPIKALDKIARSSSKGIAVAFPKNVNLRLDSSALDSVLKEARGSHIVFNAKEIKSGEKTITTAQKAFLDKEKPANIFDIRMTSDGKSLYANNSSNKGRVYFTTPYKAKDINAVPEVYYLDASGNSELVRSEYEFDGSEIVMELDHLSVYYIKEGNVTGSVTLTFQTNGGSTLKTIIGKSGDRINLSSYNSTRGGYLFDGWYKDAALKTPISKLTLAADTTVYAKWVPTSSYSGFSDVPYNAWYGGAIKAMLEKDIMGGVAGNKFAPSAPTTRGMIVTMLYRMEGSPSLKRSSSKFTDVKDNAYYKNAVSWASSNKIVTGYGASKFGPNDNITREQMAAILKSYAAYKKYNVSASARISQFRDFGRVSNYAFESVEWAVGEQLIGGKGNGLLDPRGKATRAEVASIFQRFLEKFE